MRKTQKASVTAAARLAASTLDTELLSDLMEADGLDLESDTITDFGTLIQTHLKPGVDAARRSLDVQYVH